MSTPPSTLAAPDRELADPVRGFRGDPYADAEAVAAESAAASAALAALPAPARRDEADRRAAAELAERLRAVRHGYLERHAAFVYAAVTSGRRRYLRLDELLEAVGESFPGVVPSAAQMADERSRAQEHKEGWEIDQGLFFRAVLADAQAGGHLMDAMLRPTDRALALLPEFAGTDRLDLGTVLLELRDGAAHLTINNQRCLNAEDCRLVDDLETAVDLAMLDDRVRVGVLRGGVMSHPRYAGRRVFSAGINLVDLHAGRIGLVDFLLRRELGLISKLIHGLLRPEGYPHARAHKPWCAAVDSFAIGGGMQLLFAFDHVVSADDAYFSLPAAQEGIVPGLGNLRLTRHLGARAARRVILGGHRILAGDPAALEVCDRVVPAALLDQAVDEAVAALDNDAVVANRMMLNLAEEPRELLRGYLSEFALVQARRLYAADVVAKVGRFSAAAGRG